MEITSVYFSDIELKICGGSSLESSPTHSMSVNRLHKMFVGNIRSVLPVRKISHRPQEGFE